MKRVSMNTVFLVLASIAFGIVIQTNVQRFLTQCSCHQSFTSFH